jgi:hypothetical protein
MRSYWIALFANPAARICRAFRCCMARRRGLPWTNEWRVVDQLTGVAKIVRNERGYRNAFFSSGDPDWDGV